MVTTKLNLSMTEPSVRQIYAKQGDTGRVLDITLDQTPEDGTLRILRPDGVEVTSEAVTGGEVESGETFESLTEADVTELTVGIEPVQDLNGYDKPWVGGAGKNKLNNTATTTTYRGVTFTVNSDGTVTANGTATGGDASTTIRVDTSSVYGDFYFNALYGYTSDTSYNAYMWDVTAGARCKQWDGTTNSVNSYNGTLRQVKIVQGNTTYMTCRVMNGVTANNVVFYPMIVASTETDPTWQPHSNICPITGHDEVRVTRTGKNLLPNIRTGSVTYNGITYTVNDDKSITVRGTATALSYFTISTTNLNINTTPLFKANVPIYTNVRGGLPTRYTDGTYGSIPSGVPYSPPKDIGLVYIVYASGATVDETIYPMVTYASETDDTYEPYQGSTYTTSLGRTVYGGTLDMVTGVLTVDKAMVDLGTLTWERTTTSAGTYRFYTGGLGSVIKKPTTMTEISDLVCSQYVATYGNAPNASVQGICIHTNGNLMVYDSTLDTVSATDFKTAMNGVTCVYPLATPQTYQLTPQQIKTLVGTNNVWASSGDIVSIKFTYGGLLSELPSDATSVVGKCYCDVEQNGVSSMPFTLNVKKNERAT